jgi:hypothetical protein
VLAIHIKPYVVTFDIDFILDIDHPAYQKPRDSERACFRRGQLIINNFEQVVWKSTGLAPASDSSGELDFGTFDVCAETAAGWLFEGDWGSIAINKGLLQLNLEI